MKKKLLVLSILSTLALSGCTIEIFRDWPFSEEESTQTQVSEESESSTSSISQGGRKKWPSKNNKKMVRK